jgi:adenylosuccinate lyase
MSQLYASLFYQNEVTEIFSDRALVSYMIEAEVALAQAQAQVGVIPNLRQQQFQTSQQLQLIRLILML